MEAKKRYYKITSIWVLVLFVTGVVLPKPAMAATVEQMQITDIIELAKFAFHGRAVDARTEWVNGKSSIVTHVTFDVTQMMIGTPRQSVTLTFTGGAVDGISLSLSGLRIPSVGEEGLYFVESYEQNRDTPILGWNQGQFRVLTTGTAGTTGVFSAHGLPITGLTELVPNNLRSFNENIAAGVRTGLQAGQAISVQMFKSRVRDLTEVIQ